MNEDEERMPGADSGLSDENSERLDDEIPRDDDRPTDDLDPVYDDEGNLVEYQEPEDEIAPHLTVSEIFSEAEPAQWQPQAVASQEELDALVSELGPNAARILLNIAARTSQQQHDSSQFANAHLQREAGSAPAFYQKYGPDVQRTIASLPPEQRGNRVAVQSAILFTMLQKAKPGTPLPQIIAQLNREMNGPARPAAKAAPSLAPTQRTPVAISNGRSAPVAARKRDVLAELTGVDGLELEQLRQYENSMRKGRR